LHESPAAEEESGPDDPGQRPRLVRDTQPAMEGELLGMVGHSFEMRRIFRLIEKVAPLDASVVISGETGTGKELVARAIHQLSPRLNAPFVVLDCGAIVPNLVESELFGHVKGAFTGAISGHAGAFERAHGGTLFLDELGELQLDLQPRLLRALENHEVRRVGGSDVIPIDCRVVAATHRDLAAAVAAGTFREDLYFRLSVLQVELPPLRERRDDIPHMARRVLASPEVVARHGHKRLSPEALALLQGYGWPGNVRELENVLSHALTFSDGEEVGPEHLPARIARSRDGTPVPIGNQLSFKDAKEQLLEDFEREYSTRLLRECGGNVSQAARTSGLHRKSIERLVKKYGLDVRGMRQR
jgi:DNA-binding NtrC family response regulator